MRRRARLSLSLFLLPRRARKRTAFTCYFYVLVRTTPKAWLTVTQLDCNAGKENNVAPDQTVIKQ